MSAPRGWRARGGVLALALTLVVLSACAGDQGTSGQAVSGGTAVFAEQSDQIPNYIFPLTSLQYFSAANLGQFQELMYRPLYWFGENGQVKLNDRLSLAEEPQFSADGTQVTIRLKPWKWSDGFNVSSRDVVFWINLLKANRENWAAYVPCGFPDNVLSMATPDQSTVVLTVGQSADPSCNGAASRFGSYYFTYSNLSQITPLPQHAWDKYADSGVGSTLSDYDKTPSTATQVYNYLDQQAKNLASYPTNPLWQVVDGPWRMRDFNSTGRVVFVPNTAYSGSPHPALSRFIEAPYTSDAAEFGALRGTPPSSSGGVGIDYGYVPQENVGQRSSLTSHYHLAAWADWQITYFPENYTNPKDGPIFKQTYFRQALQQLVNQPGYIKDIFKGFAYPIYGPVPPLPQSGFIDSSNSSNQLPYNPSKAAQTLRDHGWDVKPGAVTTCADASKCGVPAGTALSFTLDYAIGTAYQQEMETLRSAASKYAGIQLTLAQLPFDQVLRELTPCTSPPAGSGCKWDMAYWGGGWIYAPDYYPTGEEIFASGAASNAGSFSDPQMDRLILASQESSSLSALYSYEDYAAKNPPVVWLPTPYAQISAISDHLLGVTPQDPMLQLTPENWSLTK